MSQRPRPESRAGTRVRGPKAGAGASVSVAFLDAVSCRFAEVGEAVDAVVKELLASDRTSTWEGWGAVERISEEYGVHDVNLVKPGVGETTRVLLRRVSGPGPEARGGGFGMGLTRTGDRVRVGNWVGRAGRSVGNWGRLGAGRRRKERGHGEG
ncbi:hypothetical protein a10_09387 [Streptomyces acidiscabies]|nr:hypothetical protein a10_09387 [Streptomyces acidiscabies]